MTTVLEPDHPQALELTKLLGQGWRLQILELAAGPAALCVPQMAGELGVPRPAALAEDVMALVNGGLLAPVDRREVQGQQLTFYRARLRVRLHVDELQVVPAPVRRLVRT